jgi:hypothetical protein
MGFFSFITSDTNTSIPNIHSERPIFPVYMVTEDGQIFAENSYDGYGVFGGKDFYTLIAELNNLVPNGTEEDKRRSGIDLVYTTEIKNINGTQVYVKGKDFTRWDKIIPGSGGFTANELVATKDWTIVYPNGYGDLNLLVANGFKAPKLFEDKSSVNSWELHEFPSTCPDQGYFYSY